MTDKRWCEEDDCGRRAVHGYPFCGKHMRTRRWHEWRAISLLDRFWCRVDVAGPDECWIWFGGKWSGGYGAMMSNKETILVHRFSYELVNGPVPDGMDVDHTCHNGSGCAGGWSCPHRACVNPAHLEAVTPKVNVLRGENVTAKNAQKTECLRGHDLTDPANIKYNARFPTRRQCRACSNLARQRRYKRLGR